MNIFSEFGKVNIDYLNGNYYNLIIDNSYPEKVRERPDDPSATIQQAGFAVSDRNCTSGLGDAVPIPTG
jgi:hypothetical protein